MPTKLRHMTREPKYVLLLEKQKAVIATYIMAGSAKAPMTFLKARFKQFAFMIAPPISAELRHCVYDR